MCVCTDVGRTFSEWVPAGLSVQGREMFSFTLPCSGWGTLVHFRGRACSGTARSGHRWDSVQCYGQALEKTTGRVGCRLSDDRSSFGTANPLAVHPNTSGAVRRRNFPTSPWAVIPPRHLASMTPTCMKKQPLERERDRDKNFWPSIGLVALRKRFEGKSDKGLLHAVRFLCPSLPLPGYLWHKVVFWCLGL